MSARVAPAEEPEDASSPEALPASANSGDASKSAEHGAGVETSTVTEQGGSENSLTPAVVSPKATAQVEPEQSTRGWRFRAVGESEWEPRPTCVHQCRWLFFLLGLDPRRECWGERAVDLGHLFLKKSDRKEWFQRPLDETDHNHHSHGANDTWFNTPWYAVPIVRHHWGEPQTPLHAGATELFLDLIFVGVAYRIGVVMKGAFYACDPGDGSGSGSSSGSMGVSASGSGSGAATYGRLLAAGGSYAPCVGIGVGLAYALAHFICVYLLWSIEREHKASFRCRSKVHYVLDLICSLLLVLSSMSIDPVASYRGVPGADALIMCLGLLLIDLAIWIGRVLEVALTNPYEAPRRQASSQSLVLLQVFGLWATGWVLLLVTRTSDAETHASMCDICVVLMWLGVLRWILMTFYRPLRLLLLPGPHPIIERTFVVSNMGFQFHRNNEFMFLMLGETVLQIVVATAGRAETEGVQDAQTFWLTKLTGGLAFLMAVEMMYCFRSMVAHQIAFYSGNNTRINEDKEEEARLIKQFEHAKSGGLKARLARGETTNKGSGFFNLVRQQQATEKLAKRHIAAAAHEGMAQPLLLTAKVWTAVQQTMWQTMAMSIMLVGVGVKLAIYDPLADAHAHFGIGLRLMVGVSLSIVFALQLFYAMVIRRRMHYRKPLELMRRQPAHVALVFVQLVFLLVQALFGLVPLRPYEMVCGQAAIALVQCVLLHLHEHRINATSDQIHPLAGVPDALEAIRLKASKKRLVEKYKVDMHAVVKIQSLGRRRLTRHSTKMIKTSAALG